MLGYIYFITNKKNHKCYIGQTQNIQNRKYRHFSALRHGTHHSHKLQRAYNKYGEDNFDFTYEVVEVQNEQELMLLEQRKIAEYDTYYNGYNETLGGEGSPKVFDYYTACALFKILQRYNGVNRQIARYYKCDHSVIDDLKKNNIYADQDVPDSVINNLILRLKLEDKNLNENYICHNEKKLNTEQVFELLSIIDKEAGYDNLLAEIYNVDTKLLWRLKNKMIYKDDINLFTQLTENERDELRKQTKMKYDLEHKRLARKRGNVKNPLTQEDVDYILDNKGKMTQKKIAEHLHISTDRVSSVMRGLSYKDLIQHYFNNTTAV